jgi:hypothetical protein
LFGSVSLLLGHEGCLRLAVSGRRIRISTASSEPRIVLEDANPHSPPNRQPDQEFGKPEVLRK